jgi:uncharacterized protein (TIGR03437 family)
MSNFLASCLTSRAVRHGMTILAASVSLATLLRAQPASITNTPPAFYAPIIPAMSDAAGNVYYIATNFNNPSNLPLTPGAAQTQNGGGTCSLPPRFPIIPCADAWVAKVDASGNLVFGTLLGGPTNDSGTALAVDDAGSVFVAGSTGGSFPTTSHAAIRVSTTATAFAAKLNADGSHVLFSTYLPDTLRTASAIAIDGQGNAYIAGESGSHHTCVVKLSVDGSAVLYAIILGGSGSDAADAIAADADGTVVLAGHTTSPDFPVSEWAVQPNLVGVQNIFVAKIAASGLVVAATYLGGSGKDRPSAVGADAAGNLFVAGQTSSLDFPTTEGSLAPVAAVPMWNTTPGGFVAQITPDGSALGWSSYVMSMDWGVQKGVAQMAVSASGETYIAGLTGSGFPTTPSAPLVCMNNASADQYLVNAFLAHLDNRGALLDATYAGEKGIGGVGGPSLADDGSVLLPWLGGASFAGRLARIRFGGGGSAAACLSPGALNGATRFGGGDFAVAIAPGEIVTLNGFEIGPDAGVSYQADAQGAPPTELAGVQVLFDGQPAPVLYVQSRQINAAAPVELRGQTQTTITVVYNQVAVGSIQATVTENGVPGIFRLQPDVSPQAIAVNPDGTMNGPSNPADRRSTVSLLGTGFGPIDPPCATGRLNVPGPANLAAGWGVKLFDSVSTRIPALSTVGAPGLLCGILRIEMQVPADIPSGAYVIYPRSFTATAGGGRSNSDGQVGVTIYVR